MLFRNDYVYLFILQNLGKLFLYVFKIVYHKTTGFCSSREKKIVLFITKENEMMFFVQVRCRHFEEILYKNPGE